MGQQQLLLIVLAIIVVGLAIVVGISLFKANTVESNRNAITADLYNLNYLSQGYYKRPQQFGGGGNSYVGFTLPASVTSNANGTYTIFTAGTAGQIVFQGVGVETGDDGSTPVKLQITVTPTTNLVVKLN